MSAVYLLLSAATAVMAVVTFIRAGVKWDAERSWSYDLIVLGIAAIGLSVNHLAEALS